MKGKQPSSHINVLPKQSSLTTYSTPKQGYTFQILIATWPVWLP